MRDTHYAPVAPLEVLRTLASQNELGGYQLLIAPIILDRAYEYEQFFHQHPDQIVIVDNGVIERGEPLHPKELAAAASLVKATVVVLPDTIDNGPATARQVQRALPEYRTIDEATALMGVVQGTTVDECLWCAEMLVTAGVNWLAVPRGLTKNLKTRVPLVKELSSRYVMPMHVLGFSDNIRDDIEAAVCSDLVFGIDAATPVWATKVLPGQPPEDEPTELRLGARPRQYWTRPVVQPYAVHNVSTVRKWLHDARTALTSELAPALPQDQ